MRFMKQEGHSGIVTGKYRSGNTSSRTSHRMSSMKRITVITPVTLKFGGYVISSRK